MNTDFFDDDLVRSRDTARKTPLSGGTSEVEPVGSLREFNTPDDNRVKPVPSHTISQMAKYRQEMDEQMANAKLELEKLRQMQETLACEKSALEELRRRQQDYDAAKLEIVTRLTEGLLMIEKEQLRIERLTELLTFSQERFKSMLTEINAIREDTWTADIIREELSKACSIVDAARGEHNKALARIESVLNEAPTGNPAFHPILHEEASPEHEAGTHGFGYWFKVGFAVGLPLILTILIVAIVTWSMKFLGIF